MQSKTILMDSIGTDLEPSHVEEELEEGEHWHNNVSVCIVMEELASQHTGEHERVYSYCHYLYIVHMLLSLPVHCTHATVTTCAVYTCYCHYMYIVHMLLSLHVQCTHATVTTCAVHTCYCHYMCSAHMPPLLPVQCIHDNTVHYTVSSRVILNI
jgi:hypothetical protein